MFSLSLRTCKTILSAAGTCRHAPRNKTYKWRSLPISLVGCDREWWNVNNTSHKGKHVAHVLRDHVRPQGDVIWCTTSKMNGVHVETAKIAPPFRISVEIAAAASSSYSTTASSTPATKATTKLNITFKKVFFWGGNPRKLVHQRFWLNKQQGVMRCSVWSQNWHKNKIWKVNFPYHALIAEKQQIDDYRHGSRAAGMGM